MSSFIRKTRNPVTGKLENAVWVDNYFGGHEYGVKFPSGKIFAADIFKKEDLGDFESLASGEVREILESK